MITSDQHVLSVMVVALNEERHISGLKAALDRLHLPPGWRLETILVDGGSRDGTVAAARAVGFDECLVVPQASIPVCRNRALRAARGSVLAFLDADCLPERNWLEHAAPWLLKPHPVLLGYPVRPPEGGNWLQRAWHAHWQHKNPAAQNAADRPVTAEAFRLITTRNMLFNRAVLARVSSFNEDLTTGEDTDFAFRAAQAGVEVVALPALRVTHLGEPSTLRQYFRQQLWHANRRAYGTVLRSAGGKAGANAIWYSAAFLFSLLAAVAGLAGTLLGYPPALWGLLPLIAVTLLPAVLIADRARSPRLIPALLILYFLYGLARALDLAGLSRRKLSWKS